MSRVLTPLVQYCDILILYITGFKSLIYYMVIIRKVTSLHLHPWKPVRLQESIRVWSYHANNIATVAANSFYGFELLQSVETKSSITTTFIPGFSSPSIRFSSPWSFGLLRTYTNGRLSSSATKGHPVRRYRWQHLPPFQPQGNTPWWHDAISSSVEIS